MAMEALVERCAGLDVHQASVVCYTLVGLPGCRPRKLLRTFGTTTHELGKLRAWLAEQNEEARACAEQVYLDYLASGVLARDYVLVLGTRR